jgi:hypothetical protein
LVLNDDEADYAPSFWTNITNQPDGRGSLIISTGGDNRDSYLYLVHGGGNDGKHINLRIHNMRVHADNAAAKAAGLSVGMFYRSADGIVRCVY